MILLEWDSRAFVSEIGPELAVEEMIPQRINRSWKPENVLFSIVRRVEHESGNVIEMSMR
jgi:hypothetical protein